MRRAAAVLVTGLAAGGASAGPLTDLPGWSGASEARGLVAGAPRTVFVTGYFEPEIAASPVRTPGHGVPLHGLPGPSGRALTRGEIAAGGLEGQAPVIAWLADPVDAFFLHIQGSGRLAMPDGSTLRVGFAGRNDHPYVSIGRLLVERGVFAPGTLTADGLADWLRADPARGARLMAENPSYIFFEVRPGLAAGDGPVGAAGVPLTPLRSVALDPAHHALGAVYWLEVALPGPGGEGTRLQRGLVAAEDTGAAIRGPDRVDLFLGTGAEAGLVAGRLQATGRLWPLLPPEPGR